MAHSPRFSGHARCRPGQRYPLGRSFPIVFRAPWEDEISFWSVHCAPGTRRTRLIYSSCRPHRGVHSVDKTGHPASDTTAERQCGLQRFAQAHTALGSADKPVQWLSRHPRHCAAAAHPRRRASGRDRVPAGMGGTEPQQPLAPWQLGWGCCPDAGFPQGGPWAEFRLQSILDTLRNALEAFPNPPAHKHHHSVPSP